MMRLIRTLFQRLPPRRIPTNEQLLRERRRQIDEELEVTARQNRQRDAIYLLEQEVAAVTAGHCRRRGSEPL